MKTLLVPTDFSANARNAAQLATQIAQRTQAKIYLVHAMVDLQNKMLLSDEERLAYNEERHLEWQEKLKTLKDELLKIAPKLDIETALIEGIAEDALIPYAEKIDADLIVMGTQGASGLQKVIVGSTAVSIIGQASIPVISVPQHCRETTIRRIVLIDRHQQKERAFYQPSLRLAEAFDCAVEVIRYLRSDRKPESVPVEDFSAHLASLHPRLSTYREVAEDEVEEVLETNCYQASGTLLALAHYKVGLIQRIFRPGLSRQLAFRTNTCLLIQPALEL